MRGFFFFLLCLATGILAAEFRSMPLLFLAVAELLLFFGMLVLSRILGHCMSVSFMRRYQEGVRGEELPVEVMLKTKPFLPAAPYSLRVAVRGESKKPLFDAEFTGGSGTRNGHLALLVSALHCGLYRVQIPEMRVKDYLSLFSARRRVKEEMSLAVLPQIRPLTVILDEEIPSETMEQPSETVSEPGNDLTEVRQIREYRTGDSSRFIHWKLSARTGKVWVREFEKEADERLELYLDPTGYREASPERRDAFYEVFCAIVTGLLAHTPAVRVHLFREEEERFVSYDIASGEELPALVVQLFEEMKVSPDAPVRTELREECAERPVFVLDLDLVWSLAGQKIHVFQEETLSSDIDGADFYVSYEGY